MHNKERFNEELEYGGDYPRPQNNILSRKTLEESLSNDIKSRKTSISNKSHVASSQSVA